MILDQERMRLPALPPAPRRPGVPVIAVVAPVVMAVALWVMTSSPYALMLAFFGPVVALAGWLEGRRAQRRDRRAAIHETRRRIEELSAGIDSRFASQRAALERRAVPSPPAASGDPTGSPVLRLGTGALPSGIVFEGDEPDDPGLIAAIADLRERAATIWDAPILHHEPECEVVVDGPRVVVRSFARSLLLQALASCPVEGVTVRVPPGESWAQSLPHELEQSERWEVRVGDRQVLRVEQGERSRPRSVMIRAGGGSGAAPRIEGPRPIDPVRLSLVCAAEAALRAKDIADRARLAGWRPASEVPVSVPFDSLPPRPDGTVGDLAAVVGVDADGPVVLDLDRDGPHALVAGTTGSGKSELLVSWVLALAREHPPRDLGFLLVDFKGGASFGPLARLPHVVGMVSDLDPVSAARAVASLRAELRRREEQLALHGARSIAELPRGALSRLVIVVDEFAALVSLDAALHSVFSDLAARGRSLGLHLIVCTQRPSGVVRESVLANITLRICLRVLDSADSAAVIGHGGAARLRADQRGRGLRAAPDAGSAVQFALSSPNDAEAVRTRWQSHPRADGRPWLDPLPARLVAADLGALPPPAARRGAVVGAVDLPQQQRQEQLTVDPWENGALLVVGATGAGRSTALEMLAQATDAVVRRVPDDPAELWQALTSPAGGRRVLVAADDLDRTLAWAEPDARADLADLIVRAARDTRRSGIAIAASARTCGGAMHAVQNAFEQRLVLRAASREEHLLAGGELAHYRADRRPGSCVWLGAEAQIALPGVEPSGAWRATLPIVDLGSEAWSIVTPRPRELPASMVGSGTVVADVDGWLADHGGLTAARRSGRLLLIGCTASDHRALTRVRAPLPPLSGDDEAWHFDGTTTTRVRVVRPVTSGETER